MNTGKANVILHIDEDKEVVDIVIIETSGTGFVNTKFAVKD